MSLAVTIRIGSEHLDHKFFILTEGRIQGCTYAGVSQGKIHYNEAKAKERTLSEETEGRQLDQEVKLPELSGCQGFYSHCLMAVIRVHKLVEYVKKSGGFS